MKSLIFPICISLLLGVPAAGVRSQELWEDVPLAEGADGPETAVDAGLVEPGTHYPIPIFGNLWFRLSAVETGFGHNDNYGTFGGLVPLFEDELHGMWFIEGRLHLTEEGEFFSNLALGRREEADGKVYGATFWYDYDDDQPEVFGHTLHQVGVSADIQADGWTTRVNGYFPVGEESFTVGSPTNLLVGNNLLIQPGFDLALGAFDAEIAFEIPQHNFAELSAAVGVYVLDSAKLPGVVGLYGRLEVLSWSEKFRGEVQINYDERHQTTTFFNLVYNFQGPSRRHHPSMLMPTIRRAHIARAHQVPIFATNPNNNNERIEVVNVDNAAPNGGDGTVERPFNNLTDAEINSGEHDIIFVRENRLVAINETTVVPDLTGYDRGITLKPFQQFLGDGVEHIVQTQFGDVVFPSDTDGNGPSITNPAGTAIRLADNNVVSGISVVNIGGLPATQIGILGRDVSGAVITRNTIRGTGQSAILIQNTADIEDGSIVIDQNTIDNNFGNGVEFLLSRGRLDIRGEQNDFTFNGGFGFGIDASGTSKTGVQISKNDINFNAGDGVTLGSRGAAQLHAIIDDSTISSNNQAGIGATTDEAAVMVLDVIDINDINLNGDAGINMSIGEVSANNTARMFAIIRRNVVQNNAQNVNTSDVFGLVGANATASMPLGVELTQGNLSTSGYTFENQSTGTVRIETDLTNTGPLNTVGPGPINVVTDPNSFQVDSDAEAFRLFGQP